MSYFIYENQIRADGVVNSLETVSRQKIETAKAYFYERCSKAAATELYDAVAVKLCDELLREIDHKIFEKPVEEVE